MLTINKNLFHLIVSLLLSLTSFVHLGLAQNNGIKSELEVNQLENLISIKSTAINNDQIIYEVNYLMISIKKSKTGNLSNQRQEGKFVINPAEKKTLSEIKVNAEVGDEIKSYLFIRDENKNLLLSKDSVLIKFDGKYVKLDEYELNNYEVKSDEFILKGIVVDNTKSKGGKDFFDIFYSKYNLMNQKFPFIIDINELPSFGQNTIINIDIGEKTLYSFRVVPNEEYNSSQTEVIFRYLNNYQRESKLLDNQIGLNN